MALPTPTATAPSDVIWSSPRGMWLLDLAGTTSAGMLARIDNGPGAGDGVMRFSYAASAELAVEATSKAPGWRQTVAVANGAAARP